MIPKMPLHMDVVMMKSTRYMQPCTAASRQPGSHVWHCVMRMRLHCRCLANPQPVARDPHFSPGVSSMDPPTTQGTLRRHHHQPPAAQHRVMRFKQKLTPRRPRDAFPHASPSTARWLVLPEVRPHRHQTAPPLLPPHPPIPSLAPSMSPLLRTVRRRAPSPSSRSLLRETLSTPLLSASTSRPPCHP
jgi:hypothetical protein